MKRKLSVNSPGVATDNSANIEHISENENKDAQSSSVESSEVSSYNSNKSSPECTNDQITKNDNIDTQSSSVVVLRVLRVQRYLVIIHLNLVLMVPEIKL